VPQGRPTISTHVLDTGSGQPAAGIRVRLEVVGPDAIEPVGEGMTDADGRIRDLLGDRELVTGRYRLTFELGAGRFFERVALDVGIDDATRNHHVPLLLAPYGMASYRGS
jgi:5-hydroxyisourate hydrolase